MLGRYIGCTCYIVLILCDIILHIATLYCSIVCILLFMWCVVRVVVVWCRVVVHGVHWYNCTVTM